MPDEYFKHLVQSMTNTNKTILKPDLDPIWEKEKCFKLDKLYFIKCLMSAWSYRCYHSQSKSCLNGENIHITTKY